MIDFSFVDGLSSTSISSFLSGAFSIGSLFKPDIISLIALLTLFI
jgi:hypothetical protein